MQEWAQLNEEKRQIAIRKEQMKEQLESEKVRILCELCHAKTGLKIFVVVIAKEGVARTSPVKPYFAMTPSLEL